MLLNECAGNPAVPAPAHGRRCLIFTVLTVMVLVIWSSQGAAQDGQAQDVQAPEISETQTDEQLTEAEASPDRPLDILPGLTGGELDELRTLNTDEATEQSSIELGAPENSAKPFRIGLVPRGDTSRYLKRLQPMRAGLGDLLGRPVEILAMESFSAMIDAQTLRRIDLAFYSSSAFVMADRLCRCVEPLIMPLAADGTAAFHAIIVVSSRSNIRNISGLGGLRVVAPSPDSIGGYRMQMASLTSEGLDVNAHFGDITFVGSGSDALRMVRAGEADAAFVWSSMSGSQAAGYSRGPLSRLVRSGNVTMDDFVIVWQSKPIAHAPVAVLKSLPASDRDAAKTYLMALPESDPETYDLLDSYYGGGYKEADPTDFRAISILAEVKVNTPAKAVSAAASSAAPAAAPASDPEGEIADGTERPVQIPRQRPEPPALLLPQ